MRYGECEGHHRGLRPGHELKGVTRELGRAAKLPCEKHPEDEEYREIKRPGVYGTAFDRRRIHAISRETQIKKARKVSGEDSESERTREGLPAVLAERSTDGQKN
jgi:hypothetical protein